MCELRRVDPGGCTPDERERLALTRTEFQAIARAGLPGRGFSALRRQMNDSHGAKGVRLALQGTRDRNQPLSFEREQRGVSPASGFDQRRGLYRLTRGQ